MGTPEFDPFRDTETGHAEPDAPDPFESWPRRSLTDPMGEIAGYGRLASGIRHAGPGWRRRVGLVLVAVLVLTLAVPVAIQVLMMVTG